MLTLSALGAKVSRAVIVGMEDDVYFARRFLEAENEIMERKITPLLPRLRSDHQLLTAFTPKANSYSSQRMISAISWILATASFAWAEDPIEWKVSARPRVDKVTLTGGAQAFTGFTMKGAFQLRGIDSSAYSISAVKLVCKGSAGGLLITSDVGALLSGGTVRQLQLNPAAAPIWDASSSIEGPQQISSHGSWSNFETDAGSNQYPPVYYFSGVGSPLEADGVISIPFTFSSTAFGNLFGTSSPYPSKIAFGRLDNMEVTFMLQPVGGGAPANLPPSDPDQPAETIFPVWSPGADPAVPTGAEGQLPPGFDVGLRTQVSASPSAASVSVTFTGILQESDDLEHWTDVNPQPASPWVISIAGSPEKKFFRSKSGD